MAGSLLSRYLGMQLAKLVPVLGWAVSSAVSAATTYAIGETARRYFEMGGNVRPLDLRTLYRRGRRLALGNLFRRQPVAPVEPGAESATAAGSDLPQG